KEANKILGINSFYNIKSTPVTSMLGLKEQGQWTQVGLSKLDTVFDSIVKDMPEGIEKNAYIAVKELIKLNKINTTEEINKYIFNVKYPSEEEFVKQRTDFTPQRRAIIDTFIS